MLKHYKKQDAPAWERKIVLLLGFLLGATVLLFAVWAIIMFTEWGESVDDCLDAGGHYEYPQGECVFDDEQ